MGVAAPVGLGVDTYWSAILAGRNGIAEVRDLDTSRLHARLAGQIRDFDPAEHIPARLLPQTDRVTQLALVAAESALADAKLPDGEFSEYDMGVVLSNAQGGFDFTHREFRKLWTEGRESVSVYESFAWFYAANTGQVSIRHGMRGPSSVLVADQSGGLDALGYARKQVRSGTRLIVTGGLDSAFDPWGYISQYSHGRVSQNADPTRAYLPFDREARGYVPAEGGALFVLEDPATARDRGGEARGVLAGHGTTFSGLLRFDPSGDGLAAAIRAALAEADCPAEEVDVIFADALGTRAADDAEAAAISRVFGDRVPVTAPKAGYGRGYAASAALDVATALASLEHGVLPPTPNVTETCVDLDVVTRMARRAELRTALVLARGFGGTNSALLLRRADT
jgi:act minimal PKS chain-length factor (CLF/KS beta)